MKSIACLVIFFALLPMLHAQLSTDLSFRNYTTKDGLANDYALSLTQDKYGYIWIGTSNGLSRFDGLHFTNYFKTTDSTSLYDNLIRTLVADKYGRVWAGFKNKIGYYDYATDCFHYLPLVNVNEIGAIALDPAGNLWFRYSEGLGCIDTRTLQTGFRHLPVSKKLAYGFWIDRFNHFWIDDDSFLLCYNSSMELCDKIPKLLDPGALLQCMQNQITLSGMHCTTINYIASIKKTGLLLLFQCSKRE